MRSAYQGGLTVIEILVSVVIGAVLILSLSGVTGQALDAKDKTQAKMQLLQDGQFAMERMLAAVGGSTTLLLPLPDNPGTSWREHVREQTVPASSPETGSIWASAVLATSLPPSQDIDGDGWADANNDKDYLDVNRNAVRDISEPERIDEDWGDDNTNDGKPGIAGVDDNGSGFVDISLAFSVKDNDEDSLKTEDVTDGADNDGDGAVGEDAPQDMNGDSAPGVKGVDDDLDGSVDEGQNEDDDEDGSSNEDWLDALVYRLQGDDLVERRPLPYDVNGDSKLDGLDYVESVIAQGVVRFRVERIPAPPGGAVTVDVTLELIGSDSDPVSLHSIVRVGGAL
jgi:type II secretory pathway pseudopilin PulG